MKCFNVAIIPNLQFSIVVIFQKFSFLGGWGAELDTGTYCCKYPMLGTRAMLSFYKKDKEVVPPNFINPLQLITWALWINLGLLWAFQTTCLDQGNNYTVGQSSYQQASV